MCAFVLKWTPTICACLFRARTARAQRSPRSDTPQCFVRVEQGARVLGEGGKAMCDGVMSGGVEVTLECDPSQRKSVDELIQNPILGEVNSL